MSQEFPQNLTPGEVRAIDALIRTGSNKGAARMASVSVKTIETQLNKARAKAGVHCALHLAMRFMGVQYESPVAPSEGEQP